MICVVCHKEADRVFQGYSICIDEMDRWWKVVASTTPEERPIFSIEDMAGSRFLVELSGHTGTLMNRWSD